MENQNSRNCESREVEESRACTLKLKREYVAENAKESKADSSVKIGTDYGICRLLQPGERVASVISKCEQQKWKISQKRGINGLEIIM